MEAVSVHLGGSAPIHAIATKQGIMFSMIQVAVEVFNENPAAFGKELRRQRYPRVRTTDTVTLMRLAQLGIPPESANVVGATLLPPNSLLRILDDRRRMDLVPKVRAAMLKMITKTVTDLITRGHYEEALPVAMDAVAKGQTLYWPREPLRMVPLYLLAVKVNLGLCRPTQAQDLLGVGAWLLLQDKSDGPKDELRSEISQSFGKLSVLNKLPDASLKAFAEEVYYKSKEYGIYDVRTSIAFYNLSKNQIDHALAFWDVVLRSWKTALEEVVLNIIPSKELPWGTKEFEGKNPERLDPKLVIASVEFSTVFDVLQDICRLRSEKLGQDNLAVGEACYVCGLAFSHANNKIAALEHLQKAQEILTQPNSMNLYDSIIQAIELLLAPPLQPPKNCPLSP